MRVYLLRSYNYYLFFLFRCFLDPFSFLFVFSLQTHESWVAGDVASLRGRASASTSLNNRSPLGSESVVVAAMAALDIMIIDGPVGVASIGESPDENDPVVCINRRASICNVFICPSS
eukprot:PhM_4_TR14269/c1_g1_i1/m.59738